jgi:hypothetical protein
MKGQSKTARTPKQYIEELAEPRRSDIAAIDRLIRKAAPRLKPFVHAGMLAYGPMHYRYASGREGDWFKIGLASNASYVSLYACVADEQGYVAERYRKLLPKANIGKSCVRFKRLADVDAEVLAKLVREAARMRFGI